MNIKNRILKLEKTVNQQGGCNCSGMLIVREGGETSQLCPICVEKAKTGGICIVLPSLEHIPAGIPTRGKIYAGFDPERV